MCHHRLRRPRQGCTSWALRVRYFDATKEGKLLPRITHHKPPYVPSTPALSVQGLHNLGAPGALLCRKRAQARKVTHYLDCYDHCLRNFQRCLYVLDLHKKALHARLCEVTPCQRGSHFDPLRGERWAGGRTELPERQTLRHWKRQAAAEAGGDGGRSGVDGPTVAVIQRLQSLKRHEKRL
ncbi:Protein of unknown function [Gryllus bimaculatus]|nr:Protein of unknown function [Gryllus bimaculatus]